ncbi:MAG: FAD-dependent monooxygenase [Myxococcota bacterium]
MPEVPNVPEVPDLVVGGGLSDALFLLRAGVPVLLVERHPGTSIHPRARGVNVRTMELFRAVGAEPAVREAGRATPIALGLLRGETLDAAVRAPLGRWLRAAVNAIARRRAPGSRASPTGGCRVTQDHLEPVLAALAAERGAELRFQTELVDCVLEGDAAACTLRDRRTGEVTALRARYVVAADGARSPMRERLGIATSGRGGLGHVLNILFDADLGAWARGREFSLARIDQPDLHGVFATIDNERRWVLHVSHDPAQPVPEPDACAALVRRALGLPDLDVQVTSVLPWECAARVADVWRVGPVFLAGDAAHLLPPWGGMGANTAVADAWDLAWKLGMVLRGDAGDALLDTYQAERRPVAVVAAEDSADNTDERGLMRPGSIRRLLEARPAAPGAPGRVQKLMGWGYTYASAGIAPPEAPTRWALDARPGTRLPHAWVAPAVSTLDLVATRAFTVVGGEDAPALAAEASARTGIPAEGCALPPAIRRRLRLGDALVVRPDGFVAWRGPAAEVSAGLRRATAQP